MGMTGLAKRQDLVTKCGRKGHVAKTYRTADYFVNIYKELQQLKTKQPETHLAEAHSLDAPLVEATENYMVCDTLTNSNVNSGVVIIGTTQRESMLTDGIYSEVALLDNATTYTILWDSIFFLFPGGHTDAWQICKMHTIAGGQDFKYREGRATIVLPGGATLQMDNAMYAPDAHRSLISFKDLRANGIYTTTSVVKEKEALVLQRGTAVLATTFTGCGGLYELPITSGATPQKASLASEPSQPRAEDSVKPTGPPTKVGLWHKWMGHPGSTMFRRMVPILSGHEVCLGDINKLGVCGACAQGKLINRPSRWKLPTELPPRLHCLHGDVCGPITPHSGPFRYFMVLVDTIGIHFEVTLLSTQNIIFAKLLAMLIRFKAHYPDFPVKTLRMDNAGEFKSQHFEDYCMATGIELTYSVPYEHSHNGLAEAFIKKLQLISRPLLIQANLPAHFWSHVVLHATTLLRYRPTLLNDFSPLELLSGRKPDVFHFQVFGCQVWVPAPEPQRTTISKHRIAGVYVGFDSPSVIRYLTPSTGVLHKASFQNSQFDENSFPSVTSPQPNTPLEFWAPETFTLNPDPRTALTDSEVKKLLDLQALAEKLPDGFTNISRVTRDPLPGSGPAPLSIRPKRQPLEPPTVKKAKVSNHTVLDIPLAVLEPKAFTCSGAEHIMTFIQEINHPNSDPLTLEEAKASSDWPKWNDAI